MIQPVLEGKWCKSLKRVQQNLSLSRSILVPNFKSQPSKSKAFPSYLHEFCHYHKSNNTTRSAFYLEAFVNCNVLIHAILEKINNERIHYNAIFYIIIAFENNLYKQIKVRQELTIQRNNLKKGKIKIKEKLSENNFFNINLPDRMLLSN